MIINIIITLFILAGSLSCLSDNFAEFKTKGSTSSPGSGDALSNDFAPNLDIINDETIAELVSITQVNANDGGDDLDSDSDAITYTCTYDQVVDTIVGAGADCLTLSGVSFTTATGVFDWTPSAVQSGVYEFKIVGTDGSFFDDEIFAIIVTNVNQPPVLSAIADETVNELVAITQVNANDAGDDFDIDSEAITYNCTYDQVINSDVTAGAACGGLAGLNFTTGTGIFDWTPSLAQSGFYEFKIVGTAGALSDDEIFSITVTNVDQAPVSSAITPANLIKDTESIITLSYSDVDTDLALSCSLSALSNITISTACACDVAGVCTVGVTGTAAYKGIAGFDYTVTTNVIASNSSHATLNIIGTPFVSVWQTTGASEDITLPLRAGFNCNFTVDWGDGTAISTVTSEGDADKTHTYANAGNHTVTMTGLAEAWYFNFNADGDKIISVLEFGDMGWINLERAFVGSSNLTSFAGGDTSAVTTMDFMFAHMPSITSLDLSDFDTSSVVIMKDMFRNSKTFTSLDLSSFDTSAVTNMEAMFRDTSDLTSINLSSFNTAAVTNMKAMFYNAGSLLTLNLSSFNTSNVTTMQTMFYGVSSLTTLDLSSFDTSSVSSMRAMFQNTTNLTSINLSSFNTSAVNNMSLMFRSASSLTSLDLSNFNTSAVTNMVNMFGAATSLTTLDLSNFNTSSVLNMSEMFRSATGLTSITLASFNTSAVTNMSFMFYGASGLVQLNLSNFNTANVTSMNSMFEKASGLTSLDLSNFNTSSVSGIYYMFADTTSLLSLNASNWDISLSSASTFVFSSTNAGLSVSCNDQDATNDGTGVDGTGALFGKACSNVNHSPDTIAITPPAFYQDTESIITLSYTDIESDLAVTCNVFSLNNVSTTTACSCDGAGVCTVGVTGTASYIGSAGFYYTVTANGAISNGSYATLDIAGTSFVSTWRTSAPSESITLPLRSGYTYNFTVDWGDGSAISIVTSDVDAGKTHTYATAGDYTVTIDGTAQAWYFNNGGDKDKIIAVTEFGDMGWTNLEGAFYGCANLVSFTGGNTSAVTRMDGMFYNNSGLSSLNVSTFDTSSVTTMWGMFFNVSSLISLNLSSFITTAVTNMSTMFQGMTNLTTLDISNFNTSNVNDMSYMFKALTNLVTLDLSHFVTTSVLTMNGMFENGYSLTSLTLTSFNTSAVTLMPNMFFGLRAIVILDLSSFITTSVTDMSYLFGDTWNLTTLDISSFNTAAVTDMNNMCNWTA